MTTAEPLNGSVSPDLYGPALRSFFEIARTWRLTEKEQMQLLGLSSRGVLRSYKCGDLSGIGQDAVERTSYLLGIFKAINILLPEPSRADAWIRRSNHDPLFGGRSALERMMTGGIEDLRVVRRYLDAQLQT